MTTRTREVILVRHANADWANYAGRDFDRPLTAQGLADAQASAQAIHAAALHPGVLIASPAVRTRQTAEIIAAAVELPASQVSFVDALYNAAAEVIDAEMRRAFALHPRVIVVAHNPGISELARTLACSDTMLAFRPAQWMHCQVQPG